MLTSAPARLSINSSPSEPASSRSAAASRAIGANSPR